MGHIGSTKFRVSSDSVRVISDFGLNWIIIVLGQFNFEFRIEISSTFSYVGSGLVSGHSVQVNWIGLLLPGLSPSKVTPLLA